MGIFTWQRAGRSGRYQDSSTDTYRRSAASRRAANPDPDQADRDRADAQSWARSLLDTPGWAIIDTETTGVGGDAEAVQIGILSADGAVLLDTLLRPAGPIPWFVITIHGITDAHVATAPTYPAVHPRLLQALAGHTTISYNAAFDKRILHQTATRYGHIPPPAGWQCAMLQYARFAGQWNPQRGGYRWHKLTELSHLTGISLQDSHNAIVDCRATLALLHHMAR